MANNSRVKGITVKIGGDVSGLDKALQGVNSKINDTQAQLRDVKRLLKFDPGNTELLKQKQELLAKAVGDTKDKLEQLKDAEKQLKDAGVDENGAQFQSLRREIIETERNLDDLTEAARQSSVAMEQIGAAADKVAKGAQKVADATAGISHAAQAGLAVAAGAAVKIVDSYADYEQLIGGVETLFKGSSKKLVKYAKSAYKTAGLSANNYMETATGFAASLVSSLGGDTEKAVELVDVAITDMADNANKMGSDIKSIQNAYQGFAKQNYTMLDNLKLGFGGTKEEMQRLLDEAEKLSGIHYDIGNYADIVNAIHVIQTEMDITGTTAKEAEGTISGSIATLKAAISNLAAGMGDANADVEQLTEDMIDAFQNVADNVIPILENIWDHLPGGAKFALGGTAVVAAISPVASTLANIAEVVSKFSKLAPAAASAGAAAGGAIGGGMIAAAVGGIVAGIPLFVTQAYDAFKNGLNWLNGLLVPLGSTMAGAGAGAIIGAAGGPIGAGIGALIGLIVGAITDLVALIVKNWDKIKATLSKVGSWIKDNVITPVVNFFKGLWKSVSGFFADLWSDIVAIWSSVGEWFNANVIQPIVNFFAPIVEWISTFFEGCWLIIQAVWQTAATWFNENVIQPIVGFFQGLWEAVSGFFVALWNDIVAIWSAVAAWFDGNVIQPVVGFFQGVWEAVSGFFASLWTDIVAIWGSVAGWFKEKVIQPIVSFFTTAWESIKNAFKTAFSAIADFAKSILNGVIGIVERMINGIIDRINGLVSGFNKVVTWAAGVVGADWKGLGLIPNVKLPMLASGGILSSGSAVVGEAGPELLTLTGGRAVVQPLSGNGPSLKGVEGLLGGISDKLGAGQPVTIVVQSVLDGRVIGETAYDYTMQRARARG